MASSNYEVITLPDDEGESIDDTATLFENSIVTELPTSSETEFNGSTTLDEDVDELLRSQSPGSEDVSPTNSLANVTNNVQNWLIQAENDGQVVVVASGKGSGNEAEEDDEDTTHVEKIAAVLSDSICSKHDFIPDAWIEANENLQQVPNCSWLSTLSQDIQLRQPLALMSIIGGCCSTSSIRYRYVEILHCTAKILAEKFGKPSGTTGSSNNGTIASKQITFDDLRRSNGGEYYSGLKLRFKRVPKNKLPIIHAVQKFVTESIENAFDYQHVVLFTGYPLIHKVVEDCNEKKRLNLSPEQTAKCGLRLQQAVCDEMVDRCLNFLANMGYEFREDQLKAASEDKENSLPLVSLSSSQESDGSQVGSMRSVSSQESSMSLNEGFGDAPLHPDIDDAIRNSPNFIEFLRAGGNRTSSSGSMESYYSNSYSMSPPAASLPERDRSPIFIGQVDSGVNGLLENTIMDFGANSSPVSLISSSEPEESSQDDGPVRRRRRLN